MARRRPNVFVTGTPGVGKSTVAEELVVEGICGRVVSVSELVASEQLYSEVDEERHCTVYDEDKVFERLEAIVQETGPAGGLVVDFHSACPMALQRWFDLIIVLHADTHVLWERLDARGYAQPKIAENVECEIMNVVEEEVQEALMEIDAWHPVDVLASLLPAPNPAAPLVVRCPNNKVEDKDALLARVAQWTQTHFIF